MFSCFYKRSLLIFSSPKDPMEIVENKFAILAKEQHLLANLSPVSKEISVENTEIDSYRKLTPTKFILPLEDELNVEEYKSRDSLHNGVRVFNFLEEH